MAETIYREVSRALERAYQTLSPWSDSHRHERYNYLVVIKTLLKHCPNRGSRVMDLGCGAGIIPLALCFLGYRAAGVEKYVFSDQESPMFKIENFANLDKIWRQHGLEIFNFDAAEKLPAKFYQSYDMVLNNFVIEHLKEPKVFLNNVWQLLRAGGVVITVSPNVSVVYKRLRFLVGLSPWWNLKDWFSLGEKGFTGHWREYTMNELKTMHEWAGFSVIETLNLDIYSLIKKKTPRNFYHLLVRYLFYFVPQSREINFVIAKKI